MLVFPSDPNTGDIFGQWLWDGNKWTRAGGGGAFALDNLTDVAIVEPMADQMLAWDAVTEKWVNSAPPPRALSSLNDVAVSNPTANQLLTFNGTSWQNATLEALSGPVTVTTPTSSGLSVQLGEEGGAWEQIKITNNNPVGGALYRAQDGNGNTASFGMSANAQGVIRTNNIDRISVDQAGAVTVAAPNGDTGKGALNVNARYNEWGEIISGNPYGLYVGSNSSSAGYCAQFQNSSSNNLLLLWNDGGGVLANGIISWGADGYVNINSPTLAVQNNMVVNGGTTYFVGVPVAGYTAGWATAIWTFYADGAGFLGSSGRLQWDTTGQWGLGRAVGPPGSVRLWLKGIGDSHGLYVEGGSDSLNGLALAVWSHDNSRGFFSIRNDGLIGMLPGSPIRVYPFPVPSGSAIFDIDCRANGTNGGNALRVQGAPNCNTCWIQGASNNSGSMVVLRVVNSGSAGSQSNGIMVDAGTNSSDSSLSCRTAGGADILQARGDRSVVLPGIPYAAAGTYAALMWNAGAYGGVTYASSSQRYKRDVRSLARVDARELVQKLRAVTFHSKCEADDPNITCYGLIAEEVAKVDRGLIHLDAEGKPNGVSYERIAMLMLPLLQELLGMEESTC